MINNGLKLQNFLRQEFRKYYEKNFKDYFYLTDIQNREFGVIFLDSGKFSRHLGFSNFNKLKDYIVSEVPRNIYASAGRYEKPAERNMKEKEYINCDLIFDLDIDHIPTECKKDHDKWICKNCGLSNYGIAPKTCPKCKSHSFNTLNWECEECMKKVKEETQFIIDEFSNDFGFDKGKDLYFVFSGRRGYHIHVEKDEVWELDSNARREIMDYITVKNIEIDKAHGFNIKAETKPTVTNRGWPGRIAGYITQLLRKSYKDNGIEQKIVKCFRKHRIGDIYFDRVRRDIIEKLESDTVWSDIRLDGKIHITEKLWHDLFFLAKEFFWAKSDQPVTIDLHRLIRLPGSLHGKTGFLVKKLSYSELERFDPFSDTLVFQGHKKVFVKEVPQFRIGEETFGPLKNENVELPMNVAIFLLCKGLATL